MPSNFRGSLLALSLAFVPFNATYAQDIPPDTPLGTPPEYADPGPPPDRVVEQIADGLRKVTPDPYSVRDFSICQSHVMAARSDVKFEGNERKAIWKRAQRVVLFQFSAKNQFGAYNGMRDGIASFEGGKLVDLSSYPASDNPSERETAWRQPCKPIPDAQIQAAIKNAR
jgi:hypothetical protein